MTILDTISNTVQLGLEAQDDNSGVDQLRVGERDLTTIAWRPYSTTITWTLQSNVVYAQFSDRAGNISALYGSDGSAHALDTRPLGVTLNGPVQGLIGTAYTFTADVSPVTATLPITYVWQVTGHAPVTRAAQMLASDVLSLTWNVTGTKSLTVTAINSFGAASGTYTITLIGSTPSCPGPLTEVSIQQPYGSSMGFYIDRLYTFQAIITPTGATPPVTYTWAPFPESGQGTPYASYLWSAPDTYTITLVTQNCGGVPLTAQRVVAVSEQQHYIYLPLVLRNW